MDVRGDRIAVARLSGIAMRHGSGRGDGDPLAELREVSDDPRLLGLAAGAYLLQAAGGNRHAAAAVALLREAGADELALQAEAELVRRRMAAPLPEIGRRAGPGAQPPADG